MSLNIITSNGAILSSYFILLFGILIFLSIVLFLITVKNKDHVLHTVDGKQAKMIHLELAKNSGEVFNLLNKSTNEPGITNRRIINLLNLSDMYLPLFYSVMFVFVYLFLFYVNKDLSYSRLILWFGIVLCVSMLISEIIENTSMVRLASYPADKAEDLNFPSTIGYLYWSSRVKFMAVAITALLFAWLYFRYFYSSDIFVLAYLIPILYLISAAIISYSILLNNTNMITLGFMMILISGLSTLIYAFYYIIRWN